LFQQKDEKFGRLRGTACWLARIFEWGLGSSATAVTEQPLWGFGTWISL